MDEVEMDGQKELEERKPENLGISRSLGVY